MNATADLRQRLLALGFDAVRIARIPSDTRDSDSVRALRAWLDAGRQADMQWIDRGFEKRAEPSLVLSEASSVIILGVNYFSGESGEAQDTSPRVARYAHYADYHDTIKPALERAGRVLEESFGLTPSDYRYYVDTGPILERSWAERAGLGFIGKNAMLISRDFGNWLFLAAIFVRGAALVPDEPLPNADTDNRIGLLCGKCTRCMEACPTQAIVKPGVVDSRLCISYQTIENKGAIPRELRHAIGTRVYGCDVCAEVCPWNRFAQTSRSVLLDPRPELANLSLRDLLALTPESFAHIFRKTAIKRIKLAGILRNACVVAGNLGEKAVDCLDLLLRLASPTETESALVRAHAVWAIFEIAGHERAIERLRQAHALETDAAVLLEYPQGN